MWRGWILAAGVLSLGLVASAAAGEHTTDTLPVVQQSIAKQQAVLVDVRERREWDRGHVADAVFLPLSELSSGVDAKQLAQRLPKDKVVYTHCVIGKRSVTAADILRKHGYDVRPLKAGYQELIDAGFKAAK